MSQSSETEGTKIAQAAKDLNVTSVTIRRYLSEFDIATTSDENGIKVLPQQSMAELFEIRRLKDEGMTNPKVMELLAERRGKSGSTKTKAKASHQPEESQEERAEEVEAAEAPVKASRHKVEKSEEKEAEESEKDAVEAAQQEEPIQTELAAGGPAKHTLTCQTCGKVFEHMNPRLRDCLDCYRAKRKERRRGGSDKHKTVIQHPIAQQVTSKSAGQGAAAQSNQEAPVQVQAVPMMKSHSVRGYRKAIEETRHITTNLKRRLERPDLPEGERRWLEQIYAYQLILHQGWRHLSEYKQGTVAQGSKDNG